MWPLQQSDGSSGNHLSSSATRETVLGAGGCQAGSLKPTRKLGTARAWPSTYVKGSQPYLCPQEGKNITPILSVDIFWSFRKARCQLLFYLVLEQEHPAYAPWFDLAHQKYSICSKAHLMPLSFQKTFKHRWDLNYGSHLYANFLPKIPLVPPNPSPLLTL